MGAKIWFTGATLVLSSSYWNPFGVPVVFVVGAVLMYLGCVAMWANK